MNELLEVKDVAKRLGCGQLAGIRLIKDRELDATRSNQRNYRVGAGTVRSFLRRTKLRGENYR